MSVSLSLFGNEHKNDQISSEDKAARRLEIIG